MENNCLEKRPYYRPTTASQRKLLFRTWQDSGDIAHACQVAHVSRGTFYYWKPRFEQGGFVGLEETHSKAPRHPQKVEKHLVMRVLDIKHTQPTWGRRRIAHELMKANDWVPLVSASSVRRILIAEGGMKPHPSPVKKKKPVPDTPSGVDKP
jgi:transposase